MKINSFWSSLLLILVSVYTFALIVPLFSTYFSLLLLLTISLVCGIAYYKTFDKAVLFGLFVFMFAMVLYYFLGKGLELSFYGLIHLLFFLFSSFALSSAVQTLSVAQKRFLLLFILFLLIYSNVSTIIVLRYNPDAVRLYGYSSREGAKEFSLHIRAMFGPICMYSYGVGEALCIICPALVAFAVNSKNRMIGLLCFFVVALSIVSQAMGTLTTSLVLTIFFSGLTAIYCIFKQKGLTRISLVFFFALATFFSIPLFEKMLANSALLLNRFEDIFSMLFSNDLSGDASTRVRLITQSMNSWFANPLFGLAEIGGVSVPTGVSMHSSIFDFLGLYGIFCLPFFYAWCKEYFLCLGKHRTGNKTFYSFAALSLLLLLIIKGPATIGTNVYFSIVLVGAFASGETVFSRDKKKRHQLISESNRFVFSHKGGDNHE